jgi:hypothetical protein
VISLKKLIAVIAAVAIIAGVGETISHSSNNGALPPVGATSAPLDTSM